MWLVFEGVDGRAAAVLNGHPLGDIVRAGEPARFDVTTALAPHNTLEVDVSLDRAAFDDPVPARRAAPASPAASSAKCGWKSREPEQRR